MPKFPCDFTKLYTESLFLLVCGKISCVGLIPQPRSPTKCLWIEKSIKEGQGSQIRIVEASWKKMWQDYIKWISKK
jgi:hypothetical protein